MLNTQLKTNQLFARMSSEISVLVITVIIILVIKPGAVMR